MLNIGCHLSASKGYINMAKETIEINGNTFQFFTRNPRGGQAKDIDEKDVAEFLKMAKENNFTKILAHAPYTINVCSDKPETNSRRQSSYPFTLQIDINPCWMRVRNLRKQPQGTLPCYVISQTHARSVHRSVAWISKAEFLWRAKAESSAPFLDLRICSYG